MFPYNPSVNDTSGQIQGEYNYKGAQALANGITSAASSVGGAMASKANQGMMDRKTLDMNAGKLEQYREAGIMPEETYTKFLNMTLNKQSGALAGFEATVVNPYIQQQQYQSMQQAKQMYGQGQPQATNGMGTPMTIQ
jgi:hypothetical protein